MTDITTSSVIKCYHCGESCTTKDIRLDEKVFCCDGCKLVFELLSENNLCNYYSIENTPGISQKNKVIGKKFEYLDDESIQNKLLNFQSNDFAKVSFFVPNMHCTSCIWLLENMNRLHNGIIRSTVNFLERKISITFNRTNVSLRGLVELMTELGYEPSINLDEMEKKEANSLEKSLYYKIGIAGFAFGNIMLLSFPEYLAIDVSSHALKVIFGYLIILLSIPVFFYCSSEYFISAYKGIKSRNINIDFPLALGIVAFYIRSLSEILSHTGAGYMDSFAGLIFFLLIGRIFQNKTFAAMNFERNYKSYFPIAATVKTNGVETSVPLSKVAIGDRLIIRNNELIPVDAILVEGTAHIDYSFITGESALMNKNKGDLLYAGGKQIGNLIEVTVTKNVSQSYLTQLWNDSSVNGNTRRDLTAFSTVVSRYFTVVLLVVAFVSFFWWLQTGLSEALKAFSSILIIACPCALALSSPFALGNALRIYARNNLFLKNTGIVEKLSKISTAIFDKTGTITVQEGGLVAFSGLEFSEREMSILHSLAKNSTHPFSRQIMQLYSHSSLLPVELFVETEGGGIEGYVDGTYAKLGSAKFVRMGLDENESIPDTGTVAISGAFLAIDGKFRGYFSIKNIYRNGVKKVFSDLRGKFNLAILSGDTDREKENLTELCGKDAEMIFNQSPFDKLQYVQEKQKAGQTVLMVGDGLNDSGALLQSDVGISVSENVLNFTPASDGILNAHEINRMPQFLEFATDAVKTIKISFVVSTIYNIFGVYYAATGLITPLFAAILMPISSVTVIGLTVLLTSFYARKRGLWR
ncbi:MAG: heavy metal translocating P-type ATPase metal-binding domain-containing protein [Ignavibacteriales bacterium]|nr:heavy metal translocating P-type ATPase metal-binding domain-containing protein [Ignavibacteriales bacterium]